jgi:catechol 2,3-dioxygenase-like lactoylglutathione lyase family enzyme
MTSHIGLVSIVVRDYDEAIQWFTNKLGFHLLEDTPQDGKRWVAVAPSGGGTALLLAQARGDAQQAVVGGQWAGRVGLFLHTDDFDADYSRMLAAGVRFREAPRHEPYGTVVVFEDLCGNAWDLLQLTTGD